MKKINFLKYEDGAIDTVIVFSICIVLLFVLVVSCIEYFVPISKYGDMRDLCHSTLKSMEVRGYLPDEKKIQLRNSLENIGLKNIVISGNETMNKQGDDLNFRVEADFTYSKLKLYLSREEVTERFVYDRTSCQSKVVN